MRVWHVVYWFVTGACLVVGLDTWVLGTCFLVGMILLLVGAFALQGREAAAVILGLGVGSAALWALVAYTPFQGGPPSVPLVYAVVISILITLIGVVALVVVWRTQRRGAGPTAN